MTTTKSVDASLIRRPKASALGFPALGPVDSHRIKSGAQQGSRRHSVIRPIAISVAIHAVAVVVAVVLSPTEDAPKPREQTINLVLMQPEAPKQPPVVQQVKVEAKVPPKTPAPVPTPRHRTVPVAAANAEVAAHPNPVPSPARPEPSPSPPIETATAATQSAPAAPITPVAPPPPRVIRMEGIPSDYVNQVYAKINGNAAGHYPRAAQLQHLEGRITYRITLSPDGRLLKLELRPSGESVLDQAAEEAIRASAPFPKLPDLGGDAYQLSGVIAYQFGD